MMVGLHPDELPVATTLVVHQVVVGLGKLVLSGGIGDVGDLFSYQCCRPGHSERSSALSIAVKVACVPAAMAASNIYATPRTSTPRTATHAADENPPSSPCPPVPRAAPTTRRRPPRRPPTADRGRTYRRNLPTVLSSNEDDPDVFKTITGAINSAKKSKCFVSGLPFRDLFWYESETYCMALLFDDVHFDEV